MIALLLLVACPKAPDMRDLKAVEAPAVEAPPARPPDQEPDPLASWMSGFSMVGTLMERPSVAWGFTLDGPITAPLLADADQVYAVADGRVYAFSLDGKRLWETRVPGVSGLAPSFDAVVVGGADGRVRWLDRTTGRDKTVTASGPALVGPPVAIEGGYAWAAADGSLQTSAGWSQPLGAPPTGRPAADPGVVFVTTETPELLAVNETGVLWRTPLPAVAVDGPSLGLDHVFVSYAAKDKVPGGVVAIHRAGHRAGTVDWTFAGEFQPLGAPAVLDLVYVPDKDGHVYALEVESGARQWEAEGYGEFTTQPLLVRGAAYVGNSDGSVSRIDSYDGGVVWRVEVGAAVTAEPVLVGKTLVVGLANGRIVALE